MSLTFFDTGATCIAWWRLWRTGGSPLFIIIHSMQYAASMLQPFARRRGHTIGEEDEGDEADKHGARRHLLLWRLDLCPTIEIQLTSLVMLEPYSISRDATAPK